LLGKRALALVSAALMNLPVLFLEMMVFGLFLYVFLAYPIPIRRSAFRLNIFRPQDLKRAIRIMKESSYNSLVSNFLVGLLQASIITVGARFAGYNESVLIFSGVFAVSYIPFVGSAPLGYLLAVLSFVTGSTGEGFLMLGVATFAGIIDNIVRPFLVSNGGTEVHPVLSFASIIGSIGVFGLKGLFLGPVILTATIALLGHTSGAGRRGAQPKQRVTGVIHRLSSGQKKAAGAEADF
jgi:predicted PurR-regulated permease PerM